jgi:hypothetical protein
MPGRNGASHALFAKAESHCGLNNQSSALNACESLFLDSSLNLPGLQGEHQWSRQPFRHSRAAVKESFDFQQGGLPAQSQNKPTLSNT